MGRKIIIIEKTARIGRDLRDNYPEIAELYEDGMSVRQIALKLGFCTEYNQGLARCARAVSYALHGWDGSRNLHAYTGLMSEDEIANINKDHRSKDYVSSENRIKVALSGVVGRGYTPWIRKEDLPREDTRPGELETALSLSQDPEYLHTDNRLYGTPNWRAITEALHKQYPEITKRTTRAVRIAVGKIKV